MASSMSGGQSSAGKVFQNRGPAITAYLQVKVRYGSRWRIEKNAGFKQFSCGWLQQWILSEYKHNDNHVL